MSSECVDGVLYLQCISFAESKDQKGAGWGRDWQSHSPHTFHQGYCLQPFTQGSMSFEHVDVRAHCYTCCSLQQGKQPFDTQKSKYTEK